MRHIPPFKNLKKWLVNVLQYLVEFQVEYFTLEVHQCHDQTTPLG